MTPVEEGMVVRTDTPRLQAHRKLIVELLLAERNHICAVCVANGACELQELARSLGIDHVRLRYRFPSFPVDTSHERFGLDHNRCILCTRCVRVCDEVEGAHTWDVFGRGAEALIITDLGEPWGSSETLHQLRQVRAGLPHRRAVRQGQDRGGDAQGSRLPEIHRHRAGEETMDRVSRKPRLATVWLGGCSGCHMSFLDLDERLIDLAGRVELCASPITDYKDFPGDGHHAGGRRGGQRGAPGQHIRMVRKRTKILVSLGDCAVTGNVTAMRNMFGVEDVLDRAYRETAAVVDRDPRAATARCRSCWSGCARFTRW